MASDDQKLISSIQNGSLDAYEELFRKYYVYLCIVAEHIVKNSEDAEEIVSDVFVKLWKLKDKTGIITSVKAYLIRAVHNTSINYLEQNSLKQKSTGSLSGSDLQVFAWESDYPLGRMYEKELMEIVIKGINELPEACREIFLLSRDKEMKYEEISKKLGISVNTVKSQMKIALSRLHRIVARYMH